MHARQSDERLAAASEYLNCSSERSGCVPRNPCFYRFQLPGDQAEIIGDRRAGPDPSAASLFIALCHLIAHRTDFVLKEAWDVIGSNNEHSIEHRVAAFTRRFSNQ